MKTNKDKELVETFDLFGFVRDRYILDTSKPIKLIECFGGIGSQAKSLELLGIPFQHHKLIEWAYNSYVMYNLIHQKDKTDYSLGKTKEEMLERIKGTSMNYNEPMTMDQLNRKPIEWIKKAYNSCIATNNLVDISKVKGKDLDFDDNQNETIIMTYSFPCQDLSLAGQLKGASKGSGTRSGLLWEIERILEERQKDNLPLPNVLLMENVANLLSQNFVKDFQNWELKLESMGYTNYVQVLNAKNYGIPQNRERVFMVSILGDYHYRFPNKQRLKYRLKDFLNKNVDERYYLSEKMVSYISAQNEKWTGNNDGAIVNKNVGCTINTAPGQRRCDASNYVSDLLPQQADLQRITMGGFMIKENNSKGYKVAHNGDGINLASRMEHQRGNVQAGMIQTLKTQMEVGVVVEAENKDAKKNK